MVSSGDYGRTVTGIHCRGGRVSLPATPGLFFRYNRRAIRFSFRAIDQRSQGLRLCSLSSDQLRYAQASARATPFFQQQREDRQKRCGFFSETDLLSFLRFSLLSSRSMGRSDHRKQQLDQETHPGTLVFPRQFRKTKTRNDFPAVQHNDFGTTSSFSFFSIQAERLSQQQWISRQQRLRVGESERTGRLFDSSFHRTISTGKRSFLANQVFDFFSFLLIFLLVLVLLFIVLFSSLSFFLSISLLIPFFFPFLFF
jgi:hypothetical protein